MDSVLYSTSMIADVVRECRGEGSLDALSGSAAMLYRLGPDCSRAVLLCVRGDPLEWVAGDAERDSLPTDDVRGV